MFWLLAAAAFGQSFEIKNLPANCSASCRVENGAMVVVIYDGARELARTVVSLNGAVTPGPNPPSPPGPGPGPGPGPSKKTFGLTAWVATHMPSDPKAREKTAALAESFRQVAAREKEFADPDPAQSLRKMMEATVLSNRLALGDAADLWREPFSVPLNTELKKSRAEGKLVNASDLAIAWQELAAGLK